LVWARAGNGRITAVTSANSIARFIAYPPFDTVIISRIFSRIDGRGPFALRLCGARGKERPAQLDEEEAG
jgi:hypothetical protein